MTTSLRRHRVVLLELNEITSTILEPMLARGKLPNFQRLKREGTWAEPVSVDLPPHLDPWVTWVTLHTGVDRSTHGATVLEQDAGTIRAKRTWQYAVEAGRSIGVFGSVSAYPPEPVPGFMVPGPFAPTSATFPPYLEPVQELNRAHTHIHGKNRPDESLFATARRAASLLGLGLRPSTCAVAAAQLALEKVQPYQRYRRCLLQPLVNFDVFQALYRDHRPDYATWHSNHAAHLMHHYWRAMDDRGFRSPSPPEEKARYGGAVELGYEVCDRLLGRFFELCGDDAILVVASSMGQQPFVNDLFPEGRVIMRIKDMGRVLWLVGATGVTEVVPTMVPEWNVRIPDDAERARVRALLERAYAVGAPRREAFNVAETGGILTVSPCGLARRGEARYYFPDAPAADPAGHPLDELFAVDAETPKQGMHHPRGVLGLWGKGIRAGVTIGGTDNLDVAPTLLALLGIAAPPIMTGRILREAWEVPGPETRSREAARPGAGP